VKLSKCSFAQRRIDYLGHVISAGVATDPLKIQAIREWPTPENAKQFRSFLSLSGYYSNFVQHFGIICKPLTKLLKKHVMFHWSDSHEIAFCTLKQALIQAVVLALSNFSKQFQLETDASDLGVGVVLL
jgi:hypothetical protein